MDYSPAGSPIPPEYGWDGSYEALVAEILSGFVKSFDPESEAAWIAEADEGNRRLRISGFTHPENRQTSLAVRRTDGAGHGDRPPLVDECIAFARAKHYETLTLWTNDVLVSARTIYQAAGFRLTKEEPHRSFGKDLVGQTWDLAVKTAPLAG